MTDQLTYEGCDLASGENLSIQVGGGNILSVQPAPDSDLPYIAPGFVDLQVNGFRGFDLNSGLLEPSTVEGLSNALCQVGVSAYLPTVITACTEDICQRLLAVSVASETSPKSRQMIAGVHIEGPSISHLDGPRGAHPKMHVRPPSIAEFDRWQDAAGGLVKIITLAPELEGSEAFIKHVTSKGVRVSLGHTAANEQDIKRATDAGAVMSTHLGNGIPATLPRHPNAIWAQLADNRLSASFIADGHHLPKSALTSMIRAKGIERSILVSDSVVFAGMEPGRYSSDIGGEVDVSADGRVSVADKPYLAGSGASLMAVVCGFPAYTGMTLKDAVTMASHNPAKMLGRNVDLVEGAPANFIVFERPTKSAQVSVREIVFQGERVGP